MEWGELERYLPRLERELRASYGRERRTLGPELRSYLDILREFTLRGGKRFRALLVLAGFHIASGRRPDPALPVAAALEHFQSWMLVHDDIIDHANERRGGPTAHRVLEQEHADRKALGGSSEYGTGMAITLGDLQEPFTVGSLLSARVPADRRLAALDEYARMARQTAFGQLLDIRNGTLPIGEIREADVLEVHRRKSAIYTVASPLKIGARLARRSPALDGELEAFGTDVGIAFQLRDDVLGAGFDARASGKSANDLVEGKRTLLIVRAWHSTDPAGRELIERVLGNADAAETEVEQLRALLRASGSLAYSETRIRSLTERALARLERSRSVPKPRRALLRTIADRLVRRSA